MADEIGKNQSSDDPSTFASLGVVDVLCQACERLGWKNPTKIQKEAIPVALEGKDLIGLAETGSGKTGAFAVPVLQALLENPQRLFALVLTPTRELAIQISEQFEALGSSIGVKCAVIIGGIDIVTQAVALAKKPHIIIGTPGRLIDHLENTKGFSLRSLKFLIMDEADRILNMDFEEEVDKILRIIPKERRTYLYSATMTKKVQKLQRASLQNPVKVEVSTKYSTVEKLQQSYLFIPHKFKDCYLVSILNDLAGNSFMVFCGTCNNVQRNNEQLKASELVSEMLKLKAGGTELRNHLAASPFRVSSNTTPWTNEPGVYEIPSKRLGALNKFKSKEKSILIATDVASRGLDIPHVDIVVNFDIPTHSKDYIHRVGRTARAGRSGRSITFVTQYDVELYQRIEQLIAKKLPLFPTVEEEVMLLVERVTEAQRFAKMELRDIGEKKKRPLDAVDDEEQTSLKSLTKKFRSEKGRNKKTFKKKKGN